MQKIGITGGIGSGKSMVCRILEELGYPVFYSDDEAKEIANFDPIVREELIALFGDEVYTDTGLNRAFLAKRIFGNESYRQQVNSLIHPRVRQRFDAFALSQDSSLVFNEAAILIEIGTHVTFDAIVLVTAPEDVRLNRLMKRDGTNQDEIKSRMNKQWSEEQKRPFAGFEVVNDGEKPLLAQVENLIAYLTSSQGS